MIEATTIADVNKKAIWPHLEQLRLRIINPCLSTSSVKIFLSQFLTIRNTHMRERERGRKNYTAALGPLGLSY